jgi:hypothetical protein
VTKKPKKDKDIKQSLEKKRPAPGGLAEFKLNGIVQAAEIARLQERAHSDPFIVYRVQDAVIARGCYLLCNNGINPQAFTLAYERHVARHPDVVNYPPLKGRACRVTGNVRVD